MNEREVSKLGWLIELGCSPPQWWMGKTADGFTPDSTLAIRFARFEDAEVARCYLVEKGWREGCRSLEHLWS